MKPILEVHHLSKKFRIQHEARPYLTLRDSLFNIFSRVSYEDFYALRDVSFSVNPGETIGIIGKNGAGKSTLLKILSKITPPSEGRIVSRGRIASLLEVGTGFHPELSGKENIFLNGSILGMRRSEIIKKLDAIIEFSGVERFLDTPLKHYSSGMQLRLAFAVAAFLEPEILVIDEVLAVGDAEFQKRCMGKMADVSKSGRTILFVSHNMGAVQALCNNSIYLKNGKISDMGKSSAVIQHYLNDQPQNGRFKRNAASGKKCYLNEIHARQENGKMILSAIVNSDEERRVAMDIRLQTLNMEAAGMGSLGTFNPEQKIKLKSGENSTEFELSTKNLANGLYYLSIDLTEPDKEYYDRAEQALMIEIANKPESENGRSFQLDWNYGAVKLDISLML
ncbi:MAG: hypothetical protein Fur0041_03140 [Bacteroidia bacterium]